MFEDMLSGVADDFDIVNHIFWGLADWAELTESDEEVEHTHIIRAVGNKRGRSEWSWV
jgi:hypothetical protein